MISEIIRQYNPKKLDRKLIGKDNKISLIYSEHRRLDFILPQNKKELFQSALTERLYEAMCSGDDFSFGDIREICGAPENNIGCSVKSSYNIHTGEITQKYKMRFLSPFIKLPGECNQDSRNTFLSINKFLCLIMAASILGEAEEYYVVSCLKKSLERYDVMNAPNASNNPPTELLLACISDLYDIDFNLSEGVNGYFWKSKKMTEYKIKYNEWVRYTDNTVQSMETINRQRLGEPGYGIIRHTPIYFSEAWKNRHSVGREVIVIEGEQEINLITENGE